MATVILVPSGNVLVGRIVAIAVLGQLLNQTQLNDVLLGLGHNLGEQESSHSAVLGNREVLQVQQAIRHTARDTLGSGAH
ncbi:hypothetical protein D3C71_1917310 [compost metagenome]